jgi:hypothetical protein
MTESLPVAVTCAACSVTRTVKPTKTGEARVPVGWKRQGETVYCGDCWRKRYILRAVALPVASPVGCTWEELRGDLKAMWRLTTAACNRIMTECYARDVRRGAEAKMPPMPRVYLYPDLRKEFPALPSQTVASLEQTCQRKYRAMRYQVVWTAGAALPTYRYPTPFPIPAQGWSVRIEQDRPVVSLRIGETRRELRLKSGPQFRRQYAQVRLLARGEAVAGEAAIYQRGDALMVKLVAWLPRAAATGQRDGILRVRTAKDKLLVAVNGKDEELWNYNGDHLRRWAAEHKKQLQRWSEDAKYEARPVPSFAARRLAAVVKFRDRMQSAVHEIAAQLAGYSIRRRFAEVEYDDTVRDFCGEFPWFRMRQLISEKLDENQIGFRASSPVVTEPPPPLADQ